MAYRVSLFAQLCWHPIVDIQLSWALVNIAWHFAVVFPATAAPHPAIAQPRVVAANREKDTCQPVAYDSQSLLLCGQGVDSHTAARWPEREREKDRHTERETEGGWEGGSNTEV